MLLLRSDIRTLEKLTELSVTDLLKLRGCGRVSVRRIREALRKVGYRLKGDHD
jgi:DNA-directed RNA polymerase alpha subunit